MPVVYVETNSTPYNVMRRDSSLTQYREKTLATTYKIYIQLLHLFTISYYMSCGTVAKLVELDMHHVKVVGSVPHWQKNFKYFLLEEENQT